MKNIDVLKQMPLKNFASMVFSVVKRDCKTEEDFVAFLEKEIPTELEGTVEEALQGMRCFNLENKINKLTEEVRELQNYVLKERKEWRKNIAGQK
ncbi:MAG: hypothetical protein J6A75_11080 [Lachnospiraceae bacterium]|nr:hypothetical protein [Lachnospiraceae bacterium]